jgi:uncharacterized membrane protein YkvI
VSAGAVTAARRKWLLPGIAAAVVLAAVVVVVIVLAQSRTVNGFVVTLLAAFHTGDLSRDAADVTVTGP